MYKSLGAYLLKFIKGADHMADSFHVKNLVWQGAFMAPVMFSHQSSDEKAKILGAQASTFFLSMGMSPARQIFYQTALAVGLGIPHAMKGVAHSYRQIQESRTSLAVPFSHSTVNMDQAYASLQYAKSRMQGAYTSLGSEASYFASRYLQR